jgi:hypothetical protein
MESSAIATALETADEALGAGFGLGGTGFWSAVSAVKTNPALTDAFADRIAAIDRRAFDRWVLIKVPLHVGTTLMVGGTIAGLVLVAASYRLEETPALLAFFTGFLVLLTTTHGLAHLLVGTAVGIGFSCWFIGRLSQPQPGVKIDYASYLRTPARSRAWMHASGALVTKLTPFGLVGAAFYANVPRWTVWVLLVVGAVITFTDIVWSTKSSDWKKYRREMEFVQTP